MNVLLLNVFVPPLLYASITWESQLYELLPKAISTGHMGPQQSQCRSFKLQLGSLRTGSASRLPFQSWPSFYGNMQACQFISLYHASSYHYIMQCIYIYIYICWFNFDALAQGKAYKPTKEPINYRGPGGDRTHNLQTEATPPAASCPTHTLYATEIA